MDEREGEGEGNGTVPPNLVSLALWAFRSAVAGSVVVMWTMFLNVRDMEHDYSIWTTTDQGPMGALSKRDWEYEKKALLVDHEILKSEIDVARMNLKELENQVETLKQGRR